MIRLIIENLILVLLPAILYLGYVSLMASGTAARQKAVNDAPFVWLFGAGLILMLGVFLTFGNMAGHKPDEVYVPSTYRDGKIVPGRHVDLSKKDDAEDAAADPGDNGPDDARGQGATPR